MKVLRHLTLALMCVLLCACGDSDRFAVQGTVEGGKSMNLRYVFYNGDALVQGITAVRDGSFRFEGTAPQPVMIELYDNDYRLLGRLYAAKGDEIECHVDLAAHYRLQTSGRKDLERWTRWLRDHSDAIAAGSADSLVEAYVGAHPDDIVSTLLVATLYDASTSGGLHRADSLLGMIAPESRPMNVTQSLISMIEGHIHGASARVRDFKVRVLGKGSDTLRIADKPVWLIAMSTEHTFRNDSVVPLLRHADKHAGKRLRVIDLSLDTDTTVWRRITRPDSAKWTQAWIPGGIAARGIDSLAIPCLPYFVVADSAGRQLLRTPSASRARAFVDALD